jgi:hypothetical protein
MISSMSTCVDLEAPDPPSGAGRRRMTGILDDRAHRT